MTTPPSSPWFRRLAFPLLVFGPPVIWASPIGPEYLSNSAIRIEVAAAFLAGSVLIWFYWFGRSWRPRIKAGVALLILGLVCGAALVLMSRFDDRYYWWGPESWWVVSATGGLFCAWAGPWPQERLLLTTGWVMTTAALLSPLLMGWGIEAGYQMPVNALMAFTAAGVGLLVRQQRLHLAEQRTTVRDRERRDMAAELHDVIAHEISGIVVLSQAMRTHATDPQMGEALDRIGASGQRALDHIRSLVQTSRDGTAASARAPRLGSLEDIDTLVEEFRGTTSAEVVLESDVAGNVAGPTAVAAHRMVAEALTNVRRHAATATRVQVRLRDEADELVVTVTDDGRGGGLGSGGGTGLTGVAERVGLVGGTAIAGPRPGGGWRIEARLPRGRGVTQNGAS